MINRLRWFGTGTLLLVLIGLVMPAPLRADEASDMALLKAIPADATAFVAIRNLQELDQDINATANKLQFPLATMGLPTPLEWFKGETGLSEGLNENGGAALVVLNCAQITSSEEIANRLVILIPVKDMNAIATGLQAEKDGELYRMTLGNEQVAGVMKDTHLLVSPVEDAVREAARSQAGIHTVMSPDRVLNYRTQDLFAWVNFRGINKVVRDEAMTAVRGVLALGMMGNPMMMHDPQAAEAQIEAQMEQLEKLADGSEAACAGISLDAQVGLKLMGYLRMNPESEMGKQTASMEMPKAPLLMGLPNEPVIFALGGGGGNKDPELVRQEMKRVLDQVMKPSLMGVNVNPEKLESIKESILKLAPSFQQVAYSASSLPVDSQEGLIGVTAVLTTHNSAEVQAEIRKLFGDVKEMILEVAVKEGDLPAELVARAGEAITLRQNAEQIPGCVVDHFVVDVEALMKIDEDQKAAGDTGAGEETAGDDRNNELEQIKAVVGQEGILIRLAAVGEKNVVVTFGGGKERFAKVVELVKKGEAPLADNRAIKMVSSRLPAENRIMEGYFSIDQLIGTVTNVGQKLGEPMMMPFMLKPGAPLAMTMTRVHDTAIQADLLLLPIETAQSLMDAVRGFLPMILGGMGPGSSQDSEEQPPLIPAPGLD